jgi:hypothetical protein
LIPDAALTAEHLGPPDADHLNQGDVFSGVVLLFPGTDVVFVEPTDETRQLYARSGQASRRIVSEAALVDAMILSYDCEIDRILRRIRDGKEPEYQDSVTIAAVRPESFHAEGGVVGQIRKNGIPRYLYLPPSAVSGGDVIDFTTLQAIPLRRLLRSDRRFGMANADATARLLRNFAYHLGSDERRAEQGPDEPTLLADALKALRGN